jgi:hypothetical protein
MRIVDKNGQTASYQGQLLVFKPDERERAEMILFLVNRNAANGPFRLDDTNE